MVRALADTSFLYAIFDSSDAKHRLTKGFVDSREIQLVIPDVVLGETTYLLKERIGIHAVIKCLDALIAARIPLQPMTYDDIERVREITATYADAKFDFADCCIMALAERLNITKICTFDHRDFRIFRPVHCQYLEMLP
jgi:predicted nucleic acid-binding protein